MPLHLGSSERKLAIGVGALEIEPPGYAKGVLTDDLGSGEQVADVGHDAVLQRDEDAVRELEEAWQIARDLDAREVRLSAPLDQRSDVEREIEDVWERAAGVDSKGRHHRKDRRHEEVLQQPALGARQLIPAAQARPSKR
jgi:hypothetical protein